MRRMMLERNIEMVAGNVQDAVKDGQKRCKARAFGILVDANLIAGDIRKWSTERASKIRNQIKEGGYAMSDAIDDADFALFNDNDMARRITLAATAAGLTVLATAISVLRIGRRKEE